MNVRHSVRIQKHVRRNAPVARLLVRKNFTHLASQRPPQTQWPCLCHWLKNTPPTSEDKTSEAELEKHLVLPSVLSSWHLGKFAKPPLRTEEEVFFFFFLKKFNTSVPMEVTWEHMITPLPHTQSTSTLTVCGRSRVQTVPLPTSAPKAQPSPVLHDRGGEGISSGLPSDFRVPAHTMLPG